MKKKPFKLLPKDGDVTDVTFVDGLVEVAVAEARAPSDEYKTDSEDDFFSDGEDKDIAPITVSRPGGYALIWAI